MEKLSKYFLSIFALVLAFSCSEKSKDYNALSKEEHKKLSAEILLLFGFQQAKTLRKKTHRFVLLFH